MTSRKKRTSGANIYNVCSYSLPKLHTGKKWYVDFLCYDPVEERMKRKKYHLDGIPTVRERRARAAQLISSITIRLQQGWNVWAQVDSNRQYTLMENVFDLYRKTVEKECATGTMRKKTRHSYLCHLTIFCEWLRMRPLKVVYAYQVDKMLMVDFLDYLYQDRDVSARTRNNYRGWLCTFCAWMMEKGYLTENPVEGIRNLREEPKKRDALTVEQLATLRSHLGREDRHYLLACMMEYYTFIRPIELTYLKVGDIKVKGQKIVVHAEWAKNKRDEAVGLNKELLMLMVELKVLEAPSSYYLFGNRRFTPSPDKMDARIFSERFIKLRKELGWPDSIQFYSLKDSGIRDLANAKGIVVARDQARHTDISTTNYYLKGDAMTVHSETLDFKGNL